MKPRRQPWLFDLVQSAVLERTFFRTFALKKTNILQKIWSPHLWNGVSTQLKGGQSPLGNSVDDDCQAQHLLDSCISILHVCQILRRDVSAMLAFHLQTVYMPHPV